MENEEQNIRHAKLGDIDAIIDMMASFHEESSYENIPIHRDTAAKALQVAINDRFHQVLIVDRGNGIEGALVASAHQVWFSRKREAVDIFFATTPEARGYGAKMLRQYIAWARDVPGIVRITLGITSGIDVERTEKFYQAIGGERVGSIFVIKVDT